MGTTERICASLVALVAISGGGLGACRSHGPSKGGDGGKSVSPAAAARPSAGRVSSVYEDAGPLAPSIPVPASKVEAIVNSGHRPPYAGPVGRVEGSVRVSGDAAPVSKAKIPAECGDALATYGKLFREGPGRTVADAMVAVTEYDGFVPASSEVDSVGIRGCAFDTRTLALAYGQRIEVKNDDAQAYLPTLLGANLPARLVAIPHGDPVKLYPTEPGHYALNDGMGRSWMYADVFVVKYATHAVTGLDGHYVVSGIPVGRVKVSAYLPAIDQHIDREVEVKADQTTKVDFVLPYKVAKETKLPAQVSSAPQIK